MAKPRAWSQQSDGPLDSQARRLVRISGAKSELDYFTDQWTDDARFNTGPTPTDWQHIHTDQVPPGLASYLTQGHGHYDTLQTVRIPFVAPKLQALHNGLQTYPLMPHLQAAKDDSVFYTIHPRSRAIVEVYVNDRDGRRKLTYRAKEGKLVQTTRTELFTLRTLDRVYDSFDSDMHPDDFLRTSEHSALIARVGGRPELWYRVSRRGIVRIDIEEEQRRLDDLISWPEPMATA